MTTYGYIRTSRQRIQGTAGSDPAAQARQLQQDGVPEANIYRDVGMEYRAPRCNGSCRKL